jgi:ATP-dependent helicase STH1/SNF2
VEVSRRGTPISDVDTTRGRKGKKGKGKAADYKLNTGSKRKRGVKSTSATPLVNGNDEEEPDQVSPTWFYYIYHLFINHQVRRRKTKLSNGELPASVREQLKKGFAECHHAVLACEDETRRKCCELFRGLPDRQVCASLGEIYLRYSLRNIKDCPDYYQLITQPIAMSHLRKRANSGHYKTVQAYRDDWKLMFNNARTYNQEGSWVYIDAEEMEKVFNSAFE